MPDAAGPVDTLPFSQAAQNNRQPILGELQRLLADVGSVVEVGAGTGQHAVYFAEHLPHLRWQPTEHPDSMATLEPRCTTAELPNLLQPQILDLAVTTWSIPWPDAVYTANTLHIVSEDLVCALFRAAGAQAVRGSLLIVYGPFNYQGRYTAPSNERFDDWLKERDPLSGIRDFEWVDGLARDAGYALQEDVVMPANNRLLCWRRS